jgi:hypothetical protein
MWLPGLRPTIGAWQLRLEPLSPGDLALPGC